ncbi:LysM peptidoglycan-binding domain-containing protein [Duganella sp. sic0402]|uniref:LysM peptidoglycan-binding domain-containing protein n=1 Tax=Duganella sp. sic0402 TaxID=2854786 RepID=UPI001C4940CC|nr:LysM peptidoglycan-binding domain-containing protein [Duganella sp. sic0402]MBV7537960.1 LysM peptidoglycan-binding domain-containing protein [Duganella sp. sic0402]
MKNFSTVGTRLAWAALFTVASAASASAAPVCEFRPDAPDQHVVVKGDTLWDISGAFLRKPWCWPTVWGMNRDEIANPHWIYPGQVIWFDRAAGRLRLGQRLEGGLNDPSAQKLTPRVRTEGLGKDAVPSIPPGIIEPFLTQPLIIEDDELQGAPRIVATQEGRVFLGKGDKAYVRGELGGNSAFQVFRPGAPLKDPVTKQVIGYEAFYLGTLKLQAEAGAGSDVHTFTVATAVQEMGRGDQLRAVPPTPMQNYAPHPPAQPVTARVAAIYGGVTHAGQNQIVSINRGKLDGLDGGSVLQLYHAGRTVSDSTAKKTWYGREQQVRLPDEEMGSLFIFRTFKHISYGLIMQVTAPVEVGDVAKSPE